MKNENDDWLFNLVFWPVLISGSFLLICDLLGRLSALLERERPWIVPGFIILSWAGSVIWCHLKYANAALELKTKIEKEREIIRKSEDRTSREISTMETNFRSLWTEVRDYHRITEKLISKLEESSKYKQPVETPDAVQAAISEVTKSGAA